MKLTAQQIQEIERYLEKDKIFYDDIRSELTDHIASYLEETLQHGGDFCQELKKFMNSHHKVKLLTAIRAQEKLRDDYYKNVFLKQFISLKGIFILLTILAFIYLGMQAGIWIYRVCHAGFILMTLWFMSGLKGLKSSFLHRIKERIQIYYLIPVLVVSQSRRYFDDSATLLYAELIGYSLMFASCYFIYLTNKAYKSARHA